MQQLGFKDSAKITSHEETIFGFTSMLNAQMPGAWTLSTNSVDKSYKRKISVLRNEEEILSLGFQGGISDEMVVVLKLVDGGTDSLVTKVCDAISAASDRVVDSLRKTAERDRAAREANIRSMIEELSAMANSNPSDLQISESYPGDDSDTHRP